MVKVGWSPARASSLYRKTAMRYSFQTDHLTKLHANSTVNVTGQVDSLLYLSVVQQHRIAALHSEASTTVFVSMAAFLLNKKNIYNNGKL